MTVVEIAEVVRQFELEVHGVRLSLSIDATGIGPAATVTDRLSRRSELIAAVRRLGAGCAAALGEILDADEAATPLAPPPRPSLPKIVKVLKDFGSAVVYLDEGGLIRARATVEALDGTPVTSDISAQELPPDRPAPSDGTDQAYRQLMAGLVGDRMAARMRCPTRAEMERRKLESTLPPEQPPEPTGPSRDQLEDQARRKAFDAAFDDFGRPVAHPAPPRAGGPDAGQISTLLDMAAKKAAAAAIEFGRYG